MWELQHWQGQRARSHIDLLCKDHSEREADAAMGQLTCLPVGHGHTVQACASALGTSAMPLHG